MDHLTTHQVQKITGWPYSRALEFVRENGYSIGHAYFVPREALFGIVQDGILEAYKMQERLTEEIAKTTVNKIMEPDSDRKLEMVRLRNEEGWTLQEIGAKFNITRERVRQIVGNTGRLAAEIKHEKIVNADPEMTNQEVADSLNVSAGYVSKLRTGWHVIAGDSSAAMGNGWEKWAAKQLEKRGHKAELQPLGSGFDILLDGKTTIDVKSANGGIVKRMINPRYNFKLRKVKGRDPVDFYFLITAETKDVFIVPFDVLPEKKENLHFAWPTARPSIGKYQKYHNRYDLLEPDSSDNQHAHPARR